VADGVGELLVRRVEADRAHAVVATLDQAATDKK
jgi:hypothetical protein